MFQFLCLIVNIVDTSSTRGRGRVFEADQCLLTVVMVIISTIRFVVGYYSILEEAFFTLFDLCVTVVCLLIIGRCSIVEVTSVDIMDIIINSQYAKDKLDTHYRFLNSIAILRDSILCSVYYGVCYNIMCALFDFEMDIGFVCSVELPLSFICSEYMNHEARR